MPSPVRSPAPHPVSIQLLGEFVVSAGGPAVRAGAWRRRDASALVKVLAMAPGHQLHRERLMDALWPDLAPREAAPRLHKAAHYARAAVQRPDAVVLRGEMVSLFPGSDIRIDIDDFDSAAARVLQGGDPGAAAAVLDTFPGEPLAADIFEPWAAGTRERLVFLRASLLRQAGRWEQLLEISTRPMRKPISH